MLSQTAPEPPGAFYINYSVEIPREDLAVHDLSIVHPSARFDLPPELRKDRVILGYLSVGEVAPDAPYRDQAGESGALLSSRNETWSSNLVDLKSPGWKRFVVETLAAGIVEKGFDGFFLDTLDAVELLANQDPGNAAAYRQGLIELIRDLRRTYPGKRIVVNRGFSVLELLGGAIDGVLVESLYQTFDFNEKRYEEVKPSDTEWLTNKIEPLQAAGLDIYILDYVDPDNPKLAHETADRILSSGYHAFVSTPALDGRILAPRRPLGRRLLTLYGNEKKHVLDRVQWPIDSMAGRTSQMCLEWLGYELDYYDAARNPLPPPIQEGHVGILLDSSLDLPPDQERLLADWLADQKNQGRKVLFLNAIPFKTPSALAVLMKAFQMGGDCAEVQALGAKQTGSHPALEYEDKIYIQAKGFRNLKAPDDADVYLRLEAVDAKSRAAVAFDPIFTADWGGALIAPYVFFERPNSDKNWLVNPYVFFRDALKTPDWPAPDSTTRNGHRIFFTHIDGDGFRHHSSVQPGKRSSEIVLEQIIQKYPYPFTCSIIEAEIRALIQGQDPEDAEFLTGLARRILALDKVEAASHTYTHPFYWMENDRFIENYKHRRLQLRPPFSDEPFSLEKEVDRSVRFMEETLLPEGKPVKLFLWSGNCRPQPEAIRRTQQMGVENMNGGDTVITSRRPSITNIAPRYTTWNGELQIFCGIQNENVYRGNWQRNGVFDLPFFGGYIHVTDTFQRTGEPHRVKPANIYFHWYSGDNQQALNALTRAFEWVEAREVSAMRASEYAAWVRDCRNTRFYRNSESDWTIYNEGHCRTFRFASADLKPNLVRSRGVIGYQEHAGQLYVHTDGSVPVRVVLEANPPKRPYVESCTADLEVRQWNDAALEFSVRDLRPARAVIGGFETQAAPLVRVNGAVQNAAELPGGRIQIDLPSHAIVEVMTSQK